MLTELGRDRTRHKAVSRVVLLRPSEIVLWHNSNKMGCHRILDYKRSTLSFRLVDIDTKDSPISAPTLVGDTVEGFEIQESQTVLLLGVAQSIVRQTGLSSSRIMRPLSHGEYSSPLT